MNAPLSNEVVSIGEGFAFFRWHASEWPGHCPGHPHDASEQTFCRRKFQSLNQNIPALDRTQETSDGR